MRRRIASERDRPAGIGSSMTPVLHGIPNCDTVRAARSWLDGRSVAYRFHDYRRLGVPAAELQRWIEALGWEALLNRRGSTWRRLDDAARERVVDADSAAALMRSQPSLIRRPVLVLGEVVVVGFDETRYAGLFGRAGMDGPAA